MGVGGVERATAYFAGEEGGGSLTKNTFLGLEMDGDNFMSQANIPFFTKKFNFCKFGHGGENLAGSWSKASGALFQAWVRVNFRHIALMAVKLTGHQVEVVLATLDGWKLEHGQIVREYEFADFIAASMFVTGVNMEAEKANHHPELLQRFGKVKIQLTTHDVGGISELDLRLAKKLDARAKSLVEKE